MKREGIQAKVYVSALNTWHINCGISGPSLNGFKNGETLDKEIEDG